MEPVLLPTGPKSHSAPVSRSEKISDGTATPGSASSTSSSALSSADPSDLDAPTEGQHDESGDYAPDFLWMTTEEPHRSRRIAILKAHPEVRKLMGPTWVTVPLVFFILGTQLALSVYLSRFPTISLPVLLTAYVVGGAANQNIFLAIHEITHNLALKSIKANKCLAIIANLTIGVPYAMAFKGYHIEHHKFLGEDGIDTDLPSRFEALVLNNVAGKTFFATFQLLFYAIRPGFIRSQQFTRWHAYNILSVVAFHLAWYHIFGIRPWVYLVLSSFFAGSLHPCAAHFIAEHYLMEGPLPVGEKVEGDDLIKGLAQETTSYYGWLNILCYNASHSFTHMPMHRC
ncbi:sphingolipid delta-4 desaturase [Cryptococcus wingfieldii CBS 7118]|uniref:Sphingolipid delta-4 desaturase n=1 Tax=Cryptococcus wingfieldii CBS 7118 TaxID=1295528 RepID=A0A1E3JHU4_9TREE|nr:sphingolipid delta-4 desaturase [Cryptococcus wingfieldii CBS 7118]ODN99491.1 sphingolipid delta-4 desaturase [Cryptococcus wingfieldii CBS 7118]